MRENAGDHIAFDLSFAFDWFQEWRKFSLAINVRYNQKFSRYQLAMVVLNKITMKLNHFMYCNEEEKIIS